GRDPAELSALMGPGAADISQILPELSERIEAPAAPAVNDPRQARFRLFDSITSLLAHAAAARPLVVILDDLQSADTPSLLLTEFLAGALDGCRLLVVGTYRIGLTAAHPLEKTLVVLRGEAATSITLAGLGEDEVARFMEVVTGARPPEPVLSAVYRQTEGNPLFVREVVRLLAAEGHLEGEDQAAASDLDLPETVREAIVRRMDHLSPGCNDVLAVASAIGREFDLAVLQRVSGIPAHRVSAALEEAVAARVLVELSAAMAPGGSYRFNHTLLRETISGGLVPRRRRRLHRRIAEALEQLYGDDLDAHLAELAHHYEAAGRGRAGTRAIDYAARAGERAASLLAFEEASSHYERALRSLGGVRGDREIKVPEPRRCDLLLALGETQWRAGDTPSARQTFTEAASIARSLHDSNRLAAAAVGYGEGPGGYEFAEGADDVLVGLLEEALAALESWRPPRSRRPPRRAAGQA